MRNSYSSRCFRQAVGQKEYAGRTDFQMRSYWDLLVLGMMKNYPMLISIPKK